MKTIKEKIQISDANVIGISLYTFDTFSLELCKYIKENSNVPVVIGGAGTSHLHVEAINILRNSNYGDYLVLGPGEIAFPKLIKSIVNEHQQINISNVVPLRSNCNRITSIINREPIRDLNSLALPDFSLSQLNNYGTPFIVLPLQTARGCVWRKCKFCSHHSGYLGEHHGWSINWIIQAIYLYINKYNCRHIVLHDDELSARRAEKIADAILNENISNLHIYSYARLDKPFTKPSRIAKLKKAGFDAFSWGVESGSQKLLNKMNKGTNISTIKSILKTTSSCNVSNTCWFLLGYPTESAEDQEHTLKFIKDNFHLIDLMLVSKFSLQKDSPIAKDRSIVEVNDVQNSDPFSNTVTYRVIDSESIENDVDKFFKQIEITTTSLSMDSSHTTFQFHPINSNRSRLIPFLLKSLSATCLLPKIYQNGQVYFPVIFGKLLKFEDKSYLHANVLLHRRTSYELNKKERLCLSRFEEIVIAYFDGEHSLENITSKLVNQLPNNKHQEIKELLYNFLLKLSSKKILLILRK